MKGLRRVCLLVLTLIMGISLVLTGCGNSSSQNTDTKAIAATDNSTESKVQDSTTSTGGPVKLTALVQDDSIRIRILNQFYKVNLEKELPGIEVTINSSTEPSTKVKLLNAAGQLPDVFWVAPDSGPVALASGNLLDLTTYITEDGFKAKYKNPASIAPYKDGKIYSLSAGSDQNFVADLYYHKSVWEKAGLTPPKTYSELLDAFAKFKAKGIMGISGDGFLPNIVLWQQFVMAQDPQFIDKLISGTASVSDEISVNAFNYINELLQKGYMPPDLLLTTNAYDTVGNFKNGKVAIYDTLSFQIPNLNTDPDVGVFPFPAISPSVTTGSVQMYWGGPMNGFAVNSKSKNIAEAVKLAEYFAMQDAKYFTLISKYRCGLDAGIPLVDVPALDQESFNAYDAATIKVPNIYSQFSPALSSLFSTGFSKLYADRGSYDVSVLVKNLTEEWDKTFK